MKFAIDLIIQRQLPDGNEKIELAIDPARKHRLLYGLPGLVESRAGDAAVKMLSHAAEFADSPITVRR